MRTPIIDHDTTEPAVFEPGNLLEGARRQKGLPEVKVPVGCLLDMDGELVERLVSSGRAAADLGWPCFHTKLYRWNAGDAEIGIVGGTVGAPFAVLVAEELFASGCEALLSISSAGLIASDARPPLFVLIERALRDEGTSYHYAEPSEYGEANAELVALATSAVKAAGVRVIIGATWTTDAPFRETVEAIEAAKRRGILAVEMEAAALYTFAKARHANVLCIAHVTNTMGQADQDFEKGEADGTADALKILEALVQSSEPLL